MPAPTAVPVTKVQEVANPGLHRFLALKKKSAETELQAAVAKLAAQVEALEAAKAAVDVSDAVPEPTIDELKASLKALSVAVAKDEPLTSAREIGAGIATRPKTAPYRSAKGDTASVVSWSADAFGKSKTPGWYHTYRKQLYAQRAARAAGQPDGTFVSHSKYADEAVRIAATGRLAFSAGK